MATNTNTIELNLKVFNVILSGLICDGVFYELVYTMRHFRMITLLYSTVRTRLSTNLLKSCDSNVNCMNLINRRLKITLLCLMYKSLKDLNTCGNVI